MLLYQKKVLLKVRKDLKERSSLETSHLLEQAEGICSGVRIREALASGTDGAAFRSGPAVLASAAA